MEKIFGFKKKISENKTFKNTLIQIKESIDEFQPVVAGALDMYHLNYYPEVYHKRHIPIHFIAVTGYDDIKQEVNVRGCSYRQVKKIPYKDF